MKRITIFFITALVAISLVACGRNNSTPAESTAPSTDMNILPDMDPTLDTNIPDPSVDTSMPMYTDGTENTTATDGTSATDNGNGAANGKGMG